jgi:hypothetical protein
MDQGSDTRRELRKSSETELLISERRQLESGQVESTYN